jgi:hypothetical protein
MYKQKSETTNITKIIVNHRISDELLLLSSRVYNCMRQQGFFLEFFGAVKRPQKLNLLIKRFCAVK